MKHHSVLLRLAGRLAFSPDPRQRWRQCSIVVAAIVAGLAALTAAGVVQAADRADRVIAGRWPAWSPSAKNSVLQISTRAITLPELGQIPVIWLEPVPGSHPTSTDGSAMVPPGLLALPGPGEAVLSPGLVRAGYTARDFGFAPSTSGSGAGGTIGDDGIISQTEGRIYARPAAGRTLGSGGALLYSRGYGVPGEGILLETNPEVPTRAEALLGVVWLLLIPAAYLLVSAGRAISSVRDERARTLWRLGVSTRVIRTVLFMETLMLTAAGGIAAFVAWWFTIRHATQLPFSITELMPDALVVPLPQAVLAVVMMSVVGAASTVIGPIRSRSHAADTRRVRPWHTFPLGLALSLMAIGPMFSQSSSLRIYLLFGGLILTFLSLPMALPVLVSRLGRALGRWGHPAAWLAGRRMSLRAGNLSKPAAVVGAFVFVAGSAFAIYDRLIGFEENGTSTLTVAAYSVNWRDERAGDAHELERLVTGATAFPIRDQRGRQQVHAPDCATVGKAAPLGMPSCDRGGGMSKAYGQRFMAAFGMEVTAAEDHSPRPADSALVIGPRSMTQLDIMRSAEALPAVNIIALQGISKTRDPRAAWMLAGWVLASLLLVVALMREIGDRALASMSDHEHLLRVGLTNPEIEATYRWSLLPPLAVSIPIGFLGAVVFSLLGYELGVTIDNILRIATVSTAAAAASALTTFLIFRIQRATTPD